MRRRAGGRAPRSAGTPAASPSRSVKDPTPPRGTRTRAGAKAAALELASDAATPRRSKRLRGTPAPAARPLQTPAHPLPARGTSLAPVPAAQATDATHGDGRDGMEALLREAREQHGAIPQTLKDQIVIEHTALIRYIVNRIAVRLPSHIDLDDLHNTGVIGLMDAIDKYDPDKNCKFKTYAEFRIKGAILDQLRSLDWVPRSIRQKSRRLEQAYVDVEQRLGRSASDNEVADSLGLALDEFHLLINQVRGISMVNLDELRSHGESDQPLYGDIFEDVKAENPFASLKSREVRQSVADCIAGLPEKERLVISLYYYEDLNMKEIGNVLGITESRVCQIHTKAVARLRSKLRLAIA
jgi:RNA polymerase sigma factor for flagellar operon FliA